VGLTIRDTRTSSLLCDYPKTTVVSVRRVKQRLFRIQLTGRSEAVAVELTDTSDEDLQKKLEEFGIASVDGLNETGNSCGQSCLGMTLPSLEDMNTKIVVLELLLSDEFEEFTRSLQVMVEGLQHKLID
jgi:hypothetical protein